MYSDNLKGAPSNILIGFSDHHILLFLTPSNPAINKWQPNQTEKYWRIVFGPSIYLFVIEMTTFQIKLSGKHIRKRSNCNISAIEPNCGFYVRPLHYWCLDPPSLDKWLGSPNPHAPPVSDFSFCQRAGFQGGSPYSQPRRLAVVAQQYLLGLLLGQYYCLCSRLILLLPGCCRVHEREDELMRLEPIILQMVAQGIGLL